MKTQSKKAANRLVSYKQQEAMYGPISEKLRQRIEELIKVYDPINKTTKIRSNDSEKHRDNRLPIPGSIISKIYKGKKIDVKVLESGFEHNGTIYKNLSAVAKAITGSHWNGFIFFGFRKP